MYTAFGWFVLSESLYEDDIGGRDQKVRALETLLGRAPRPHGVRVALFPLHGTYYLTITADANRRRSEAEQIAQVIPFIAEHLPGSYGLLYERDDETTDWPGPNTFCVRYLARGQLEVRGDPFLSPCWPTIEDPTIWPQDEG